MKSIRIGLGLKNFLQERKSSGTIIEIIHIFIFVFYLRYLEHIDKVLDLRKDISFNTLVQSANFNTSNNTWDVITNSGVYKTKYFILCVGIGSKRYVPSIKGLESFSGTLHHTSSWPRDVRISFNLLIFIIFIYVVFLREWNVEARE